MGGGQRFESALSMIKYDSTLQLRTEAALSDIERLTITLPTDMATLVKGAVTDGDYASVSEVVRDALRDWKVKHAQRMQELAALKADIGKGLKDIAESLSGIMLLPCLAFVP